MQDHSENVFKPFNDVLIYLFIINIQHYKLMMYESLTIYLGHKFIFNYT